MGLYYNGLIIGIATFLIIGFFHPIVIKAEYHMGLKSIWIFAIVGIVGTICSLFIKNFVLSTIIGVFAFSSFWGITEVLEQKERVRRGWFPMNPKRKKDYDAKKD